LEFLAVIVTTYDPAASGAPSRKIPSALAMDGHTGWPGLLHGELSKIIPGGMSPDSSKRYKTGTPSESPEAVKRIEAYSLFESDIESFVESVIWEANNRQGNARSRKLSFPPRAT
jgi:hypothetical protein